MKQTKKVGVAGSFINQMMGNNSSVPVVGEWATILHYSDRSVAKIIEVTEGGKKCRAQRYEARAGKGSHEMGHQDWVFEPIESFINLTYRHGSWKSVGQTVQYTQAYMDLHPESSSMARTLTPELKSEIYMGGVWPKKVVEGITFLKTDYNKLSIIFGQCDYYYDWSF